MYEQYQMTDDSCLSKYYRGAMLRNGVARVLMGMANFGCVMEHSLDRCMNQLM